MLCGIIEGVEVRKGQLRVVLDRKPLQIGLVPEPTQTTPIHRTQARPRPVGAYQLIRLVYLTRNAQQCTPC